MSGPKPEVAGTEIADSILDLIGNTPMVKLPRLSESQGLVATLAVKLETTNPGGSVKDRPAVAMIDAAERAGLLKPGGTIVEPTSGNTGVGLAIVAAQRGYKCVFVMTDKVAPEKIAFLRAYGAEVVVCPVAVAPEDPQSYYSTAERLVREIPGAFRPNQYANPANPQAHVESTGPEIWRQTAGRVTHFVAGLGTGGTITGIGRHLKSRNPDIQIIGADPEGSVYSGGTGRPYLVEGIGEDFWPTTYDPSLVDRYVRVSDRDAFRMARRVTREEGILVGSSSGTAVVAALTVAAELPAETTMVVILPDTGRNYLSKAYSDTWLLQYGLMERPEIVRVEEVLSAKHGHVPPLVTVNAHAKVRQAIDVLHEFNISQAPVVREDGVDVAQFVGGVHETSLLDRIFRDPDALQADVAEVMGPPIGLVEFDAPIELAFETLQHGPAVLVEKAGQVLGVLTRSDLLEFLAHRSRV